MFGSQQAAVNPAQESRRPARFAFPKVGCRECHHFCLVHVKRRALEEPTTPVQVPDSLVR
ncbi:hypothetical protein PISMIDRAFT_682727 [Pisolithus microcarpus 441]|uniref:Uncharacterized protein n=1 Tax=Pisolithus microcarpus 441 TaxID=765257 RepID=A0A0C9Z129_9AGAM|nr:hypothetical protein PISMIDRAFT_682727 [Pisolithus microcarpus 441]